MLKGIGPSYLNDMPMSSLNNYNTRSEMAVDIEFCRTGKYHKKKVITWIKDLE